MEEELTIRDNENVDSYLEPTREDLEVYKRLKDIQDAPGQAVSDTTPYEGRWTPQRHERELCKNSMITKQHAEKVVIRGTRHLSATKRTRLKPAVTQMGPSKIRYLNITSPIDIQCPTAFRLMFYGDRGTSWEVSVIYIPDLSHSVISWQLVSQEGTYQHIPMSGNQIYFQLVDIGRMYCRQRAFVAVWWNRDMEPIRTSAWVCPLFTIPITYLGRDFESRIKEIDYAARTVQVRRFCMNSANFLDFDFWIGARKKLAEMYQIDDAGGHGVNRRVDHRPRQITHH